jgi:hypothetical protein
MKTIHFSPRLRWLALFLVVLPLLTGLAGCSTPTQESSSSAQVKMASMDGMPAAVQKAPANVREAYQFAVANPAALKNVPCYCGCGAVGHTSNYSCYVKEIKPSGEIVFDNHALGCGICVDIAQDVLKYTRQGKSPQEIRTAIDQTFSQFGPSNMAAVQ